MTVSARPASQLPPVRTAARSRVRSAVARGTWGRPRDGVTHGSVELDVTEAERWCAQSAGVSLVHVVGCGLAHGLVRVPDANARVVMGAARVRERVDVSFVVDIARGHDMGAVCVRDADDKTPREVARELFAGAREIRRGSDGALGRARAVATRVPAPLLRVGMRAAGFVAGGLGLPVPGLRVQPHPFGSVLVSSLEAWDVPRALPPLVPFAHLGFVVTVGASSWRPWVVDGEVVPRRLIEIGLTFDHRLVDGAQMATVIGVVRDAVERPWEIWPQVAPRSV
jgi:hypothetical protein